MTDYTTSRRAQCKCGMTEVVSTIIVHEHNVAKPTPPQQAPPTIPVAVCRVCNCVAEIPVLRR